MSRPPFRGSFWKDGQTPKKARAKRRRSEQRKTPEIRRQVFLREASMCRCCHVRQAQSLHELFFRSLGGKRSLENSIAVCGSGTTGCHGLLQKLEIACRKVTAAGAGGLLIFTVNTAPAAAWLTKRLGVRPVLGHSWPSEPRVPAPSAF